jgi:hypothetical protein
VKKREDRRDRYGEAARREHMRVVHPSGVVDCVCERSAWKFAKSKSVHCRCRRRRVGGSGSPKVAGGWCHGAGFGYHPTVIARIAGKRLTRGWLGAIRGSAHPDDVVL